MRAPQTRPLATDRERRERARPLRLVLRMQAAYFLVTGLWGVVHRPSFEWIAGPKTDYWLVRVAGSLIAAIGAVLVLGARRPGAPATEVLLLASGSAAALGAVEAHYSARRRISLVYLADALLEAVFVVAVLALWARARRGDVGVEEAGVG